MASHTLVEGLNSTLQNEVPAVFSMLSQRGKLAFFPYGGILGQSAEAKGKAINATIGIALEDDGAPMALSSAKNLIDLDPKNVFPYAPAFGLLELRTLWQSEMLKKNPSLHSASITLPIVTGGLTHSLSTAAYLFVDREDEVLLSFPHWDNYPLIFEQSCGATIRHVPLFEDTYFSVKGLAEALSTGAKKKILLLNFPNNPTGYTPLEHEARAIVSAIFAEAERGSEIVVLLDDAYFGLVYVDGVFRESLFALLSDLHPNVLAVKIDGPTKEEFTWGFRIGFLTFGCKGMTKNSAKALEDKTAGVIRATISNANHASQHILISAMQSPTHDKDKNEKFVILKRRFEVLHKELLAKEPLGFFQIIPSNSGYFSCIELQKNLDGERMRNILLTEFDTGVITFGNLLRIAFSSVSEEKIPRLVENIIAACSKAGQPA